MIKKWGTTGMRNLIQKSAIIYVVLLSVQVPFNVVFFSIFSIFLFALIASRGTIIFAFPIVIVILLFVAFCTWIVMIPGAFYSIQVIRFGRAEGKISAGWSVWHMFLQFIFLADILDTIYLAVRKWNRGKAGAVIIGGLYAIVIARIIWMLFIR